MFPKLKNLTILTLLASLLVIALPSAALADHNTTVEVQRVEVQRYEFPVTLSNNQTYTIVGYLYTRHGNPNNVNNCGQRKDTLQVTVAGATYDHEYWDAPVINNVDYSYARYMVGQCYSVLALDRLGTGESSRPDGDSVTLALEADSIQKILTSLRDNANPTGRKFKTIVLVGHSFGSMLAVYTLGNYGNVADGLVVTGWLHAPGTTPLTPELIQFLLQNPYITVAPEIRSLLFYYLPSSDPDVIAYDNSNISDTLARGYFLDGINIFVARAVGDVALIKALTKVDSVQVPVFAQLGDNDILFPSVLAGTEASFYSSSPSVTLDMLTNIGHGFNLHTNHAAGWQQIEAWISTNMVK